MRTKKTGKILLRDALIEAMLREFDRDMEKCEESPICSPEHYKKMSEIVGFDVTKPRRKPIISYHNYSSRTCSYKLHSYLPPSDWKLYGRGLRKIYQSAFC